MRTSLILMNVFQRIIWTNYNSTFSSKDILSNIWMKRIRMLVEIWMSSDSNSRMDRIAHQHINWKLLSDLYMNI